jgi:hypothetical protein
MFRLLLLLIAVAFAVDAIVYSGALSFVILVLLGAAAYVLGAVSVPLGAALNEFDGFHASSPARVS